MHNIGSLKTRIENHWTVFNLKFSSLQLVTKDNSVQHVPAIKKTMTVRYVMKRQGHLCLLALLLPLTLLSLLMNARKTLCKELYVMVEGLQVA